MSGKSPIQWTEQTWNPVVGCTRVSEGCDHCYAFELHDRRHVAWKRGRWPSAPAQYHQPFSRIQLLPERLADPLRWRTPRCVFVNSMSDLFHKDVPDGYIEQVFGVMASTPQHTYQVLTKRPDRMAAWVAAHTHEGCVAEMIHRGPDIRGLGPRAGIAALQRIGPGWPLPNVWLGTSVENQATADERIPHLVATPAVVRFLSCEPLLGPLDLSQWLGVDYLPPGTSLGDEAAGWWRYSPAKPKVHWVIVGGESGSHARFLLLEWVRSLLGQCEEAGAAVFVKQLGTKWATFCAGAKDRHGGDPAEWPEDLRIREYPTAKES